MKRILFLLFVSFPAVAQAHPLVAAAERGDLAAVRCMIESGVNIESRNEWGETALIEACDENRPAVVEYLIKNGANVNAVDDQGENPLAEAIEEFLGEAKTEYHIGGGQDNLTPTVLDSLLKDPRIDVNATDPFGRTPLMRFAEAGKTDWVARLLRMGANVGEVDRKGRTALDRTKDVTIQKMLRDRGAT